MRIAQSQKDAIINKANEREFCIDYKGKKYAAKLAGSKLNFPFAWSRNELGQDIDIEISWSLALRIANEETNIIIA